MPLQIKNLHKTFPNLSLFRDFNIDIQENAITCILGPSGCGKTSLLNLISGSIVPDSGVFNGFGDKSISYIFQDPRLLQWKTALENVSFVLSNDLSKGEKAGIARKYLDLVELNGFEGYYPAKLSGGMKQRVAIARAFAYPSDIILMDEPLKALDLKLKMNLMDAFRRLWQSDKRTVIFVTHDIDEALLLGKDIYVFSKAPVCIKGKFIVDFQDRQLADKRLLDIKAEIMKLVNVD